MMQVNTRNCLLGTVCAVCVLVVSASPAHAIPPDPDNAALLYYQAFLSVPDFNDTARALLGDIARGKVEPNELVRKYVDECHGAIGFAEAARDVPTCDWGFRFSQGFEALMPQLSQARLLTFILVADARIRAADGDYRGALERCLMTRIFARHIGDDTLISYLVSIAVRALGYKCMQDLIGPAADDAELLRWLQSELATDPGQEVSPARSLKIEMEIVLEMMQIDEIDRLARLLAESNEEKMKEIVEAANEELIAQARKVYADHATAMLRLFSMTLPYEQAHAEFKRLASDFDPNDPASAAVGAFMPAMGRVYTLKTKIEAQSNAVRAGIAICLARAKSQRLPEALPDGLPKDPFSGKDFEYKQTDDGFLLRCRTPDLDKDEVYEYPFVLK